MKAARNVKSVTSGPEKPLNVNLVTSGLVRAIQLHPEHVDILKPRKDGCFGRNVCPQKENYATAARIIIIRTISICCGLG